MTSKVEVILKENTRDALYPLDPKYHDIWESHKKQRGNYWVPEEINMEKDQQEWPKLHKDVRYFLEHILAFFAVSDKIVAENLNKNFIREMTVPEIVIGYEYQTMMENIHHEVYSLFIDSLIKNEEKKMMLFKSIQNLPVVSKKAKWAQKWISSDEPFSVRLIAFACVEGIFFSGSFCAIDWLKSRNELPGLSKANEFISRDEGEHVEFACILYSHIINRLTHENVHQIIREAVEIEQEFVKTAIPVKIIGMNADLMCEHIEHCANILSSDLGYDIIYKGSKCPFVFMETRSLKTKTNFFENTDTNYKKASSMCDVSDNSFNLNADF